MNDFVVTMQVGSTGIPQFHLSTDPADLTPEAILETSVIISFFTNRLANEDDEIPDGTNDRRGYWADPLSPIQGDLIGSHLWLLSREKQLSYVLKKAKQYAEESLEWMLIDGVASAFNVTATFPRDEWLGLEVEIYQPDDDQPLRFSYLWRAFNAV